ncbi:LysR family transcriptional regulator [Neoroseomonas lacus]|uniref:LysR family transcriptional regulator n=1 Tax=Neoroseomonas lacus TaxID=287609 RepID=A0A917KQP0_9PROT|nr:LysR family transcriptional regulator [Neoroseomonas lacus]GGJ23482.1 LysR family transcriptional regulator [Neoroseomonas lacus]
MNLLRLRSFLTLSEAGGFRRAAELLGLSQPALTRQIQVLEAEFGAPLVRRGRQPVTLTEAGRFLAQHAGRLLAEAAFLRQEVQRLDGGRDPTLCVGVLQSLLEGVFSTALVGWRRDWPGVPLRVLGFRSEPIMAEIIDGRQHLGFVGTAPTDPRLVWRPMVEDVFVAVLPPHHRLAREGAALELAALAAEGLVLPPPGFGLRDTVDMAFAALGLMPRVTAELEGIGAIVALVQAGLGPSVLPASAVSGGAGFVLRQLAGLAPRRELGAVWHAGRHHDAVLEALVNAVQNAATTAQILPTYG